MYQIYVLPVSTSPKFHSVSQYGEPFLSYRIFWEKCTAWPPNDLEPYKVKCTPYMYNYYPRLSNQALRPAILRYKPFWVKCTEWPQIDLEPYKVKSPYICITGVPDSQVSLRFAVRPAISEIQAILRQVHQMTPKCPWTPQGQRYPIYVSLVSTSPIFHSVRSTTSRFRDTGHFETSALNDPHIYLEPCTTSHFRDTGHFETSALNDPHIYLEPCKVKLP